MYEFATAAITKYHTLSGYTSRNCLTVLEAEVQDQGVGKVGPFRGQRGRACPGPLSMVANCWCFLAGATSLSSHGIPLVCVSLSKSPLFRKDTSHFRFGTALRMTSSQLIISPTTLTLRRSHSEVLQARTSTYEPGEDISQHNGIDDNPLTLLRSPKPKLDSSRKQQQQIPTTQQCFKNLSGSL